jgi:Na+/H+ antiporter NhaC
MTYLRGFLPVLLFVGLFVGSGIYFTYNDVHNAFYQLSPLTAIIPAIMLGWFLHRGNVEERMHAFLDGVRHRDVITMCIIFLLAGAFSEVTKSIGSVEATVNLSLSLVPSNFLLIGLFLTSAFIATSIGTSMGTIATIAPIAAGLSSHGAFDPALSVATVVGGAMFGDNLSIVSDTTIASVMSQKANMRSKLILNAKVALIASAFTIAILFYCSGTAENIEAKDYTLLLVAPYLFLIMLAVSGINVFVALVFSLIFAWVTGYINTGYSILQLSGDLTKGFASMQEIMLLSLMVGGLSGLVGSDSKELAKHLGNWISKHGSKRMAQLVIAKIVSIFDILLANNTIAIIFSGEMVRDIAKKHDIPPHYSAAWLDIFSCVFQGIIPYGAQILLASIIAGVSPLSVTPHVYYCYILAVVAVGHIMLCKIKKKDLL